MKRLALRVFLSVITFLFGLGVNRLVTSEFHSVPELSTTLTNWYPALPTEFRPTATATNQPEPQLVLDLDFNTFDPSGTYLPLGKLPKVFKNFLGMSLEVSETHDKKLVGYMNVSTVERTDEIETLVLVTKNQFFFITQPTAQGIAYRFDGRFLRGGTLSNARRSAVAVLRGELTKTRNGRTIAKSGMSFRIVVHNCKYELV